MQAQAITLSSTETVANAVSISDKPIVWTIAGSDSGGGAGIQADLATITDLGCHGCSVITGVTAQNSLSVAKVEPVSNEMLLAQLNTLLADMPPKAIKIGLLCNQNQVDLLAAWLANEFNQYLQKHQVGGETAPLNSIAIILDPVLVATCGDALVSGSNKDSALSENLVSDNHIQPNTRLDFSPLKGLIDLITPNVHELHQLTAKNEHVDKGFSTLDDFKGAAMSLANTLQMNVLAKGGDANEFKLANSENIAADYFVCHQVDGVSHFHQNSQFMLSSSRQSTSNTHGTGCTLSSAIAAALACDYVLHDAIVLGKAYINSGLKLSYQPGRGAGPLGRGGWPTELELFPFIEQEQGALLNEHENNQLKASTQGDTASPPGYKFTPIDSNLGLYSVVDNTQQLAELLVVGVETIQLRIKVSEKSVKQEGLKQEGLNQNQNQNQVNEALRAEIATAISLGEQYQARVFINDHWREAIEMGAYGVHVGQEDLYQVDFEQLAQSGLALGISSHSYFEALLAHQIKPSYIAFGHIFPTQTKDMPSAPQGLAKLSRYASTFNCHYPCVAIGGINLGNLNEVKQTGIADVAIVSAITQAANGQSASQAFLELNQSWQDKAVISISSSELKKGGLL